jgi:four helix bundle protein
MRIAGGGKRIVGCHHLKNQLLRAASSVALNLSEGSGRRTRLDQRRFFDIPMGSIRECQAIVEIEAEAFTEAQKDLLDYLAASTFKLIRRSTG